MTLGDLPGWTVGRRSGFVEQLATTLMHRVPSETELEWFASAHLLRTLAIELWSAHADKFLRILPSELRVLSLWATGPSYPGNTWVPWSRVPHLTRLEVFTGSFFEPIAAPALEELVLRGPGLDVFDKAVLPALRVLHLVLHDPPTGAEVAALLARLPTLRHLAIHARALEHMEPPEAQLEIFELVNDGWGGPGRRRFVIDRSPQTPCAGMLCLRGEHGRLIRLVPGSVDSVDGSTIEWSGAEWWLRETSAILNRTWNTQVPLRDGDELVSRHSTHRFIAAPTEAALAVKVEAMRSRHGLAADEP